MADKKISQLTGAATPLAGTEVLPIVQSGTTVKVSVADLTAGRSVSATNISAGLGAVGTPAYTFAGDLNTGMWSPAADTLAFSEGGVEALRIDSSANIGVGFSAPSVKLDVNGGARFAAGSDQGTQLNAWTNPDGFGNLSAFILSFNTGGNFARAERMRIDNAGNITAINGNLIVGTAGKGIDFSANTHAAGMTSELLNDYEEGTFTPSITSGATGITYAAQVGSYTKIGRLVTFSLNVVISAASAAAANFKVGGLPFTAGSFGSGSFAYDNGTFVNSATTNMPMIFVTSGTTEISFFQGNGSQVQGTDINAIGSMNFYIVGSYIV